MRVLVTGVTGFVGSHLAELLLTEKGIELTGADRQGRWSSGLEPLANRVRLIACDLTDAHAIQRLVRDATPERVYHLAGYPHSGRSVREVEAAWAGNLVATRNLYEAVLQGGGN